MSELKNQVGEAPNKKSAERANAINLRRVASGLREAMSDQPPSSCVIHVGEDGNFSFLPATLHARRKDTITWYCEQGEFALHFGARTPFKMTMLPSQGKQIVEEVHDQATLGAYRYVVAARARGKVLINACPEIIIEDPPGKPGLRRG